MYEAEMAASHFLQVQVKSQVISLQVQVKSQVISLQVQVKSQVIWSDVKSSHKSFGPNTSQVTSLFVQVQVKSHIILSSCNTQSGPGIKSIYSELVKDIGNGQWYLISFIDVQIWSTIHVNTMKLGGGIYLFYFLNLFDSLHRKTLEMCNEMMVKHEYITIGGSSVAITIDFFHSRHKKGNIIKSKRK